MDKTVQVRGVTIGAGRPKIIVPIVARTRAAVVAKGAELARLGAACEVVEWRADFYEGAPDIAETLEILAALRGALGEVPLLFTCRTAAEGGEKAVSPAAYTALNRAVAQSGNADLIDVEMLTGDEVALENLETIHAAGVRVIGSSHDFSATPPAAEIVARLRKMQQMGADILKIALMPQSRADVLALLCATLEMSEKYAEVPIVTMSMSAMGAVSRVAGGVFGSAMTFGAAGQGSAPGQLPAAELLRLLQALHGQAGR